MKISVQELLNKPFSNRTQENKNKIVLEGKPRPLLDKATITISENGYLKTAVFDPAIYDKVSWLTGCESDKSFYCWPCLLFPQKSELWKVSNPAFLSDSVAEHEHAVEHIQATLNLKTFSSKYLEIYLNDQWNPADFRNREILKLLINAVCTIVAAGQPGSCQNLIKPEMCVKSLNLIKLYNNPFCEYFDKAIELVEMLPTLLYDLVDAMTIVVKLSIMKESGMSTYTALIFSDHSTNRAKSRISVVLRYIKKGKVCERFLGFISILASKNTDVIYNLIKSTVNALGNVNKFLAYSFDGAVLTTSQLTHLIGVLQNKYPKAYFVPCYFQGMLHILQQSLSENTELTEFLKILIMMEAYFRESSEQRKALEQFIFINTSKENKKLYNNISFIKILCKYRKHFIQTLEVITENSNAKWSADDHIKAHSFLEFLGQFHTVFLIRILSSLFEHIMPLDEAVRNTDFRHDIVVNCLRCLSAEKDYFEGYFNSVIAEMSSNVDFKDQMSAYHSLYIDIINHLEKEVRLRFNKLDELAFCSLSNMHSDDNSEKESSMAMWYLKSNLSRLLGPQFTLELLVSEVNIQYANRIFKNKNAYDMLNCFEDSDLKKVFVCTNRLLEFTLTMPFKPAALNKESSKFKKIVRFSFPTACIQTHGDACILYIESDILRDLQKDALFHDDVIQKLCNVNKNLWKILDENLGKQ